VSAVSLRYYMGAFCRMKSYPDPLTALESGSVVLSSASSSKTIRTTMPFRVVDHVY
jgi:hypothetical protein